MSLESYYIGKSSPECGRRRPNLLTTPTFGSSEDEKLTYARTWERLDFPSILQITY